MRQDAIDWAVRMLNEMNFAENLPEAVGADCQATLDIQQVLTESEWQAVVSQHVREVVVNEQRQGQAIY
jgi:hypothetical protein